MVNKLPKLKPETRQARNNLKIAELLGLDLDEVEKLKQSNKDDSVTTKPRQAEAVLSFVEDPSQYVRKTCKSCKELFLTNYKFVAYCSDVCRRNSLMQIGIDWMPHRSPEERWRRAKIPIPYVIPAPALKVLLAIALEMGPSIESVKNLPIPETDPNDLVESIEEQEEVTLPTPYQTTNTTQKPYEVLLSELGIL